MRRHIPGLHSGQPDGQNLEGLFLVRVERALFRWHPKKPFLELRFVILEPTSDEDFPSRGGCTAPKGTLEIQLVPAGFWLRRRLLSRDQVDEKALLNLRGVVRTRFTSQRPFLPESGCVRTGSEWEALSCTSTNRAGGRKP